MPLPVIADTMRVAVRGHLSSGHHWVNVLHYRKTGALSFSGAIAILDPILLDHLSTNNGAGKGWNNYAKTTAGIEDFVYTPLNGVDASTVNTHIVPGLSTADAMPGATCLVVTLRTTLRGRSHRGRVYQGPFNEAANDVSGVPLSTEVAAVAAQWNAHITALVGTGVTLVVASYKLSTATDVATCTVDARWDTQRRRNNT
jgi:hypothetical protein